MTDKLMECITNPVKCKLLLEIYSRKQATAKQLASIHSDIPQATLYRNLKKMLSDGILKVANETQVRGTVEKTYEIAFDLKSDLDAIPEKNSGELYMRAFMQYIMGFASQFQQYCQSSNINIKKDMSGFSLSPMYLSDEELLEMVTKISAILNAAGGNTPNAGRKLRTIGLIITPPENIES